MADSDPSMRPPRAVDTGTFRAVIEDVHDRVGKIETKLDDHTEKVTTSLTAIALSGARIEAAVAAVATAGATHAAADDKEFARIEKTLDKHESALEKLKGWKMWMTGIGACVSVVAIFVWEAIIKPSLGHH